MRATASRCALGLVAASLSCALAGCGAHEPSVGDELGDSSTTDATTDDSSDTGEPDILDALLAIEGMRVVELEGEPGVRVFELGFLQPADHDHPERGWFEQKIYLRHRAASAPMVLFTTGYHLYVSPQYDAEPTTLLQANQLAVEQRFFATSRPEPVDWTLLTIAQAAADHHRIVEALRPVYPGGWLSSGASKGGMTSIYHRRFYPDDVDATLAYVAPHSASPRDERYIDFLEQLGDPACAQAIRELQVTALARRATLMQLLATHAGTNGFSYERFGGLARTFEAGIVESRWAFWQYAGANFCDSIPGPASSDQDIHEFIDQHLGWDSYDDAKVSVFEPYYYQAATQLGAPAFSEPHIENLLIYPLDPGWKPVLPAGTKLDHDAAAMADISAWMSSEGERLMFVYGEWDPWAGAPFDPTAASDAHVYWVANASHRAKLAWLPDAQFDEAVAILDDWMGTNRDAVGDARALRAAVQPLPLLRHPRR